MQDSVIVHPLVLIGALDHYKRIDAKRVIGIVLGTVENHTFTDPVLKTTITYTEKHLRNSFAIPFEEEDNLWFYDTSFFDKLLKMHYKVNKNEQLLGWYFVNSLKSKDQNISTKERNIEISKSFLQHVEAPITLELDIAADDIPCAVFEYKQGNYAKTNFRIESSESEEVGVEFLMNKFAPVTDYDSQSTENLKKSLEKYEERLQVILSSINKMIETGVVNYYLIDCFQKCLNEIKKGRGTKYNEVNDINDHKAIEMCKRAISVKENDEKNE